MTNLLDSAVTLATESANGTLTSSQISSANQEYQNILTQIGNIGSTTNFNSSNVFSANPTSLFVSDGSASGATTYNDVVGTLSAASVGTTAGSSVAAVVGVASSSTSTGASTVVRLDRNCGLHRNLYPGRGDGPAFRNSQLRSGNRQLGFGEPGLDAAVFGRRPRRR